jgi:GH35 family endo-1,4-beta-xylanase
MRDLLHQRLRSKSIAVEGRLLYWFHKWVTPAWQKAKTYDQLRSYVEKNTREVIGHYGDGMYAWEIVNEIHDWANECRLTPDQIVELTRLACDVAASVAPNVHRMVNNCCPYAEYVQMKQWSGQEALYPQRTPVQFIRDLVDAGVDFTIIGQQMYFPFRDLQDMIMLVERYEQFGKRVQISEIGASSGPTDESVKLKKVGLSKEPFVWHRPWDEELQADWLEGFYTLLYGKPYVQGANWFDFVDPYYFIDNGGLLRTSEGEKKAAFDRLLALENRWKSLPSSKGK